MENLTLSVRDLAKYIDHTLLRPDAILEDYKKLCVEAIENKFFSVCIPPSMVTFCSKILSETGVKVCTVIGFPFGNSLNSTKTFEAKMAIEQGADELDMVLNIASLKNKETSLVADDISSVVAAASGRTVKVILETCYLTDDEKVEACKLSVRAGAKFVKTSTGFGPNGATKEDVILMLKTVLNKAEVKASGGIRNTQQALDFINLGVTRLGTSQGVAIVNQLQKPNSTSY